MDITYVYSVAMMPYVEHLRQPGMILDAQDIDSEKWTTYAETAAFPMRLVWAREGRTLFAYERRAAMACDATLFVSPQETARFAELAPETADRVHAVENGVDLQRFSPALAFDTPFADAGPHLVFTGNMDYWPNADAVLWFVAELMPGLRAARPGLHFHIVGANPGPDVLRLAAQPGVHVTGRVPDVRPYVAHADVCVAPLRIARGIQNKVLEAMAMARPVVASPQAYEGVRAAAGQDLLVADGAAAMQAAILSVLDGAHPALAASGRAAVEAGYAWSATLARPGHDPCSVDAPDCVTRLRMSATATQDTRASTYLPALLALALGLAALAALFLPEGRAAVRVWIESTAYGHCFLVIPIAAYLAWDRRDTLRRLLPRPTPAFVLLALPLPFAWFGAERLGIMEGRQIIVLCFAEVLFLSVLGWRLFSALLGPFLYLFFLVPFGAFLTPALQAFTAHFIDVGLSALGIPHYVNDMLIEISAGTFFVAEACAGLRFLIASVAFGVFYALLNYRSPGRRALFIAASIIVPIIANGIRALGIVLLGHVLGSAEAAAADHLIYGWVFFSFVMLLLVAAGLPLREAPAGPRLRTTTTPEPRGRPALGLAHHPCHRSPRPPPPPWRSTAAPASRPYWPAPRCRRRPAAPSSPASMPGRAGSPMPCHAKAGPGPSPSNCSRPAAPAARWPKPAAAWWATWTPRRRPTAPWPTHRPAPGGGPASVRPTRRS